MVEKTLNLLKTQKKYSIILIILLAMTGALLWRAKWMLLVFTKLVYIMWFPYPMVLHLIGLTLIILITVLSILMINQRSYSLQTLMKLVKTYNKSLYVALGRKYAGWQVSESIKMLMTLLLLMAGTLFAMLYIMHNPFL